MEFVLDREAEKVRLHGTQAERDAARILLEQADLVEESSELLNSTTELRVWNYQALNIAEEILSAATRLHRNWS